jgi:prolyl-tRNA synthetase
MKKENIIAAADKIYNDLQKSDVDVLYDDRIDAQAGFKFNDADLLGMPIQIIVGDKKLKENKVEVKVRKTGERFDIEINSLIDKIKDMLK